MSHVGIVFRSTSCCERLVGGSTGRSEDEPGSTTGNQ